MRINVNGGHTPAAPGASCYLDELEQDRGMKEAVKAELERRGHAVTDSTSPDWCGQNDDLAHQARAVNASGAELAMSFHFNAAGKTDAPRGTEAYYYGGDATGRAYAAAISSSLAALMGLPDRGAKDGSHLYYVRETNPTAVLVEVCFVDSSADAAAYNACSWRELACAVCDAVERVAGISRAGRGWVSEGGGWWYERADGSYPAGGWEAVDGRWHLFDEAGWMLSGWQFVGGEWYYLDERHDGSFGAMLTGWQFVGGAWFWLDASGAMARGLADVDGERYLFDESGAMLSGWRFHGGEWRYFDAETPGRVGRMLTGWQLVDGDWYWLGDDGVLRGGWQEVGGELYALSREPGKAGRMLTGWVDLDGRRAFCKPSGAAARSECAFDGSAWYAFDADGRAMAEVPTGEGGAIEFGGRRDDRRAAQGRRAAPRARGPVLTAGALPAPQDVELHQAPARPGQERDEI